MNTLELGGSLLYSSKTKLKKNKTNKRTFFLSDRDCLNVDNVFQASDVEHYDWAVISILTRRSFFLTSVNTRLNFMSPRRSICLVSFTGQVKYLSSEFYQECVLFTFTCAIDKLANQHRFIVPKADINRCQPTKHFTRVNLSCNTSSNV